MSWIRCEQMAVKCRRGPGERRGGNDVAQDADEIPVNSPKESGNEQTSSAQMPWLINWSTLQTLSVPV